MKIEVIQEDIGSLQGDWERLASAENPIYSDPRCLSIWWKYFGAGSSSFMLSRGLGIAGAEAKPISPYIVVVSEKDDIKAILPLMMVEMKPYGSEESLRCLVFLGDYIFNPYPSVAYDTGMKEELFSSLAGFLDSSDGWDTLVLTQLRSDFTHMGDLIGSLKEKIKAHSYQGTLSWKIGKEESKSVEYRSLKLQGTVEEYEARLSRKKRQNINRDKRLCEKEGIKISANKIVSDKDIDLFIRYHRENHPDSVHFNEKTIRYYKELLTEIDSSLFWIVAEKDNTPVFYILCYADRRTETMRPIVYGGGERFRFNLGNVCLAKCIEESIGQGYQYFDFRMGSESYKSGYSPEKVQAGFFIASRKKCDPSCLLPRQWGISKDP